MIFQVGCIINTKLPSCVDIILRTSLGFHSWCPESTRPTDSCFQGTSCENLMMYGGLYQHTHVVLYIYYICKTYRTKEHTGINVRSLVQKPIKLSLPTLGISCSGQ